MQKCDPRAYAKCPDKHLCGNEAYFTDDSDCDKFNQSVTAQPATNADRIRSMSDEELAEFLIHDSENHAYLCCDCCTCGKPGMCTENTVCTLGVLDWLRQPAEEADR